MKLRFVNQDGSGDHAGPIVGVLAQFGLMGYPFRESRSGDGEFVLRIVCRPVGPMLRISYRSAWIEGQPGRPPPLMLVESALDWAFGAVRSNRTTGCEFRLGPPVARLERLSGMALRDHVLDTLGGDAPRQWLHDYDAEWGRMRHAEDQGCERSEVLFDFSYREGGPVPDGLLSWLALSNWEFGFSDPLSIDGLQHLLACSATFFCLPETTGPLAKMLRRDSSYDIVQRWTKRVGLEIDHVMNGALDWVLRLGARVGLEEDETLGLFQLVYLDRGGFARPNFRRRVKDFCAARLGATDSSGDNGPAIVMNLARLVGQRLTKRPWTNRVAVAVDRHEARINSIMPK